jgi:putative endonuclease
MEIKNVPWYVYILLCADGSYYVGMTKDVAKRFNEHMRSNGAEYTKRVPPLKILWLEAHNSSNSARQREIEIKGWSRKKKEALFSRII